MTLKKSQCKYCNYSYQNAQQKYHLIKTYYQTKMITKILFLLVAGFKSHKWIKNI